MVWKLSISQLITITSLLLAMMSHRPSLCGTGPMKKKRDPLWACNSSTHRNSKINTGSSSTLVTPKKLPQTAKNVFFSYLGSRASPHSNIIHPELRRKISVERRKVRPPLPRQCLFLTKRWPWLALNAEISWSGTDHLLLKESVSRTRRDLLRLCP